LVRAVRLRFDGGNGGAGEFETLGSEG
jgi:hypothetical protein